MFFLVVEWVQVSLRKQMFLYPFMDKCGSGEEACACVLVSTMTRIFKNTFQHN